MNTRKKWLSIES